MIIVSQDRTTIVNLDNTMVIKLSKLNCSEIDYTHSIFAYDNMRNVFNIGNYKTEERAKEVLKEMYNWLMSVDKLTGKHAIEEINAYANIARYRIFTMPEK